MEFRNESEIEVDQSYIPGVYALDVLRTLLCVDTRGDSTNVTSNSFKKTLHYKCGCGAKSYINERCIYCGGI